MKEVRTIIFDDAEVLSAIVEFSRKRGTPLPPGAFTLFEISGNPPVARLQVASDRTGDLQFSFGQVEVAAALIAFCIGRKVPLPAKAKKEIQLIGGATVLLVRT